MQEPARNRTSSMPLVLFSFVSENFPFFFSIFLVLLLTLAPSSSHLSFQHSGAKSLVNQLMAVFVSLFSATKFIVSDFFPFQKESFSLIALLTKGLK